eukprot:15412147-Alexandrium_andersonii.AAC.1
MASRSQLGETQARRGVSRSSPGARPSGPGALPGDEEKTACSSQGAMSGNSTSFPFGSPVSYTHLTLPTICSV